MTLSDMKLGKLYPKDDPKTLQLASYLRPRLIAPPKDIRWGKPLPAKGLGMMRNDELGDCTCAAAGHMINVWTANWMTKPVRPTDAEVEAVYWGTGDQDTGRYMLDVLNYWRQSGLGGNKVTAYVQVDHTNLTEVQQALWLFGGLYVGVGLPVSAQDQNKWTVVGDPNNDSDSEVGSWGGHAISIQASIPWWGYTCITWGEKKGMTFNFWKTYVDECYAILDSDWINAQGISPNGLDFETLQEDLKQVTS